MGTVWEIFVSLSVLSSLSTYFTVEVVLCAGHCAPDSKGVIHDYEIKSN